MQSPLIRTSLSDRTSIAIIGNGINIKTRHLPALSVLSDQVNVVGIQSNYTNNLNDYRKYGWNPKLYSSIRSCLEEVKPHLCIISKPIKHQLEAAICASQYCRFILVEKPFPHINAKKQYLNLLSDKTRIYVAENYFFIRPFLDWVTAISNPNNKVARIYAVQRCNITKENRYFKSGWRSFPLHKWGIIVDGGIHRVALLRFASPTWKVNTCKLMSRREFLGEADYLLAHGSSKLTPEVILELDYCTKTPQKEYFRADLYNGKVLSCDKSTVTVCDKKRFYDDDSEGYLSLYKNIIADIHQNQSEYIYPFKQAISDVSFLNEFCKRGHYST